MNALALFCFFLTIFEINYVGSVSLKPLTNLAKNVHEGVFDAVKGTIEGVTEVVGTPVTLKEMTFYLHTSKDQGYPNHTINPLKPDEVAATKGKIYFFIHGWTQTRENTPWFKPLTEILLKKHPDAHIVQVDWSKPAADNYASAAFSTESAGIIIGNMINKLVTEYNISRSNIVVIGHSLGGQITGWVGKRFHQLTNTKLPRIIALDPAGPLFHSRPDDKRLNKHDADTVVVLHTDGGKLGFGPSCGTIDFFPNGGVDQPDCYEVDLAKLSSLTDPIFCDHRRAYDLFVEAVGFPDTAIAKKCKDYDGFENNKCDNLTASLGDLETTQIGSYFIKTKGKSKFFEKLGEVLEKVKGENSGKSENKNEKSEKHNSDSKHNKDTR